MNHLTSFIQAAASVLLLAALPAIGQHQTLQLDDPVVARTTPFNLELRLVSMAGEVPTLHSYVAGQHGNEWVLLAGKTNGLHGMTGRNAFDPAFENRVVWVINPLTGASWSKSLETSPASGLSQDQVDSLSAVNAQFIQVDSILYVVGGYGYRRSIADHTTYATLTAIDLPALIAWTKAQPGSEPTTAAQSIRQITDPFFQVTGGGLERIGDEFQLIFGQNYAGAYRPFLNGIYTQQVRRFRVASSFPELAVVPQSMVATPPSADFRRRDLNVLPIVERRRDAPFDLEDKALVLGGVFTLAGGVWTLPVVVSAGGNVEQMPAGQPQTLHQALQQYHCAKLLLYNDISDEMHCVLFGGISLKYYDFGTGTYLTDENAPFVNDVTNEVRYPDGSMRQFQLPHLFPGLRAPWDDSKLLLFGTNAEFFKDPAVPLIRPKIVDMQALAQSTRVGWIHGGIMAEAPNFGRTAASGYIFEVWLHPVLPPAAQARAELQITNYTVSWQGAADRVDRLERSTDLQQWTSVERHQPAAIRRAHTFALPLAPAAHRVLSATPTSAIDSGE
jgi:hypothetical protein